MRPECPPYNQVLMMIILPASRVAQQTLYSSQALVSMLVASQRGKSTTSGDAGPIGDSLAPTRAPSHAPSRAATPGTASTSSDKRSQGQQPPQNSLAAVEAQFGLDPLSVAMTSIERLEVTDKGKERPDEDDNEETDDGEDPAKRYAFANDAEQEDFIREKRLVLAQKRAGLSKAVQILRAGANHLGASTPSEDNGKKAGPSSSSTNAHQRWQALREAKRKGWGLTPGRPGRQTPYGQQQIRSDEGEQDAWIGFAVPETRTMYARRGLAYMSHDSEVEEESESLSVSPESQPKTSSSKLIFASRRRRRLRVSLLSTDQHGQTRTLPSRPRPTHDAGSSNTRQDVDLQLREAQAVLVDQELFDDLAAEARLLSSQGVVSCETTDTVVTLGLAATIQLVFELSDTDTKEVRHSGEPEGPSLASSMLSLLEPFLLLNLTQTYEQRAAAAAKERARTSANAGPGGPPKATSSSAAPKASSGDQPTSKAPAPPQVASQPSAKKPKTDLWVRAPYLMPLIGLAHYLSFAAEVRRVVGSVLQAHRTRTTESDSEREKGSNHPAGFEFESNTTESISSPSKWLLQFLEGQTDDTSSSQKRTDEARSNAKAAAVQSLRGSISLSASIPVPRNRSDINGHTEDQSMDGGSDSSGIKVVLTHLRLGYPSNLTVTLPMRRTLRGHSGVTLHNVEWGNSIETGSQGVGDDASAASGMDLASLLTSELADFERRRQRVRDGGVFNDDDEDDDEDDD